MGLLRNLRPRQRAKVGIFCGRKRSIFFADLGAERYQEPMRSSLAQKSRPQASRSLLSLGRLTVAFCALTTLLLSGLACSESGGSEGSGGAPASGGDSASGGAPASGGDSASGGDGSGGAPVSQLPSATTLDAVAAFIAEGSYKTWTRDETPRDVEDHIVGSPHAGSPPTHQLQTYVNAQAVDSIIKNKDLTSLNKNHDVGSMAVKEVYDASGTRLAVMAMIKVTDTRRGFAYYCDGDGALCGGDVTVPFFSPDETGATTCSSCHGGSIYFPLPEAP